ncbi:MAG: ATP-binding protein [Chloroflexota bacterium]
MLVNRLSIRWRLSLWFMGLLLLALVIFLLFFYFILQANLSSRIDETLDIRADQLQREINLDLNTTGQNNSSLDSQVLFRDLKVGLLKEFAEPGIYTQILDLQARIIASSPNLSGNQLPVDLSTVVRSASGQHSITEVRVGEERLRILSQPINSKGGTVGVLQVAESLQPFLETMSRVRLLLSVGTLLTLAGATAGGWWFVKRAMLPVVQVTQTARKIATTRNFAERLPLPNRTKGKLDEIGQLSATFNQMIEELSRVFENNRQFMADTSHELRSPLTVIRGNLNLLRRGLDKASAEEAIAEAEEEAERLSLLVGDLLLLAQTESERVVEYQPVQLDQLMLRVVRRAEQLVQAQQKNLEIKLESNQPALVMGDEMRLLQVINNLVENAARYTPDQGQIILRLEREPETALISVRDTGIGIPPEHLPRLFERFYRVDKARSRALGGSGLGLAIVKYLTEAHGGQVRVESVVGKGTLFEICLPLSTGNKAS